MNTRVKTQPLLVLHGLSTHRHRWKKVYIIFPVFIQQQYKVAGCGSGYVLCVHSFQIASLFVCNRQLFTVVGDCVSPSYCLEAVSSNLKAGDRLPRCVDFLINHSRSMPNLLLGLHPRIITCPIPSASS